MFLREAVDPRGPPRRGVRRAGVVGDREAANLRGAPAREAAALAGASIGRHSRRREPGTAPSDGERGIEAPLFANLSYTSTFAYAVESLAAPERPASERRPGQPPTALQATMSTRGAGRPRSTGKQPHRQQPHDRGALPARMRSWRARRTSSGSGGEWRPRLVHIRRFAPFGCGASEQVRKCEVAAL